MPLFSLVTSLPGANSPSSLSASRIHHAPCESDAPFRICSCCQGSCACCAVVAADVTLIGLSTPLGLPIGVGCATGIAGAAIDGSGTRS